MNQQDHHPQYPDFTFFKTITENSTMKAFERLTDASGQSVSFNDLKSAYFKLKANVTAYAMSHSNDYQYAPTLWHDFVLSRILSDDNPLTLLFEHETVSADHPFYPSMLSDVRGLLSVYHFDWQGFLTENPLDDQNIFDLTKILMC